ncbi:MAG: MBL fold metallo-hydrolase [Clostridia bacterium]|nr:MBL fold metallo-hydrolase [Clostridia bacterium]
MKFQYLGTSTAEGLPTMFCKCPVCEKSRKIGGRAIRTRTQAAVDGTLLIDFPPETSWHMQREGLCLADFTDVLITHRHMDHLYPADLEILRHGFAYPPEHTRLVFRGSAEVGEYVRPFVETYLEKEGTAAFAEVTPFAPFRTGRYTVTPLPAVHAPDAGPVIYQITDGEKTILYAHDTNYFREDVWTYWENTPVRFDFVSLDCTYALADSPSAGHMNLEKNKAVRARMLEMGIADENTVFVCNHFSHNGGNAAYDDFVPAALSEGFLTSYDGMAIEI